MSKLYQLIALLPIILFFSGCADSIIKKPVTPTYEKSSKYTAPIDSRMSSTMSNKEKIQYIERLFETSITKNGGDKNPYLINALYLCSEVFTADKLKLEEKDYTLELSQKIISQLEPATLNHEQENQLLLTSASIELTQNQFANATELLNQEFNSSQADLWSLYHKIRAISYYQQGQKNTAIKELIFRQNYIMESKTSNTKLANQVLIWKYLNHLSSQEITQYKQQLEHISLQNAGLTSNEQIYIGWLDLADIFRQSNDPQTNNSSSQFWLQSYPNHPADKAFINYILQHRQESIMDIKHIAILLPMQGKLSRPATTIHNGIMAAHYNSSSMGNIQLRIYDTSATQDILSLHQQAITNGADFIIGPLQKTNVEILLQSSLTPVSTLALNNIENTTSLAPPENLFQFGLSPEADARIVAKKGLQDGHQYAAIMVPDSAWGQRMKKAFSQYWQEHGGIIVNSVNYSTDVYDFSESIKSFMNIEQSENRKKQIRTTIGRKVEYTPRRRQDIDMLFLAAFPKQAKQIPLQIIYHHGETIPIYSTAHIVSNYHDARQNLDLDGVIFSDMPFLLGLTPGATSTQSELQSLLYERLFAMGVDSYQIAPYINFLAENPAESFSGDTGQITIDNNKVIRSLPWASFEQGNLKLENPMLLPELESDSDVESSFESGTEIDSSNTPKTDPDVSIDNATLH